MKQFGLIGYPLGHSFSKKYFTEKFKSLGLTDHQYDLFEMKDLQSFPSLFESNQDLVGVNVTVPFKQQVMSFLDELDSSAKKVGAVNTIKREGQKLVGYNSDYFGFKYSLQSYCRDMPIIKDALILGSGGASKAVMAVLEDLGIGYKVVSRVAGKEDYTYQELKENLDLLPRFKLVINTTPVGMYPKVEEAPDLPFNLLSDSHVIYDLVYNPEQTLLMQEAEKRGARTKNGLEMLYLQAD
ncbi:MAG: shikimate dehydrogenase, partial [Cyclobacteriaceae bacterium]